MNLGGKNINCCYFLPNLRSVSTNSLSIFWIRTFCLKDGIAESRNKVNCPYMQTIATFCNLDLLFAELINFIEVDLEIVESAAQFMILIFPILWHIGCIFCASH